MSPRVAPGRQEQRGQVLNGAGEYNAGQDPEGARAISILAASPSPGETRSRDRPETMPEQHVTISRHTVEPSVWR